MTAVHVAGDAPSSERPRPHPDIETAFVAPQTILYDDRSGSVYELSPSASAVWLLLDGEATVADVTLDLAEILGRSPGEVAPDVGTALADFRERGLLADDDGESAAGANDLAPSAPAEPPIPSAAATRLWLRHERADVGGQHRHARGTTPSSGSRTTTRSRPAGSVRPSPTGSTPATLSRSPP